MGPKGVVTRTKFGRVKSGSLSSGSGRSRRRRPPIHERPRAGSFRYGGRDHLGIGGRHHSVTGGRHHPGIGGRLPQEFSSSLSVTSTSGAKPCFLSSLRISFTAAALSRRRCTRRSRTSPSSSTAPEPELRARNHHCHLIEMPLRHSPRASTAKFSGEQWPELQDPSPHRLVGDIQTALREQIFDVAIAERETHIKPNGVPDDHRGELVADKRDHHAPSYPPNGCALSFA